LKGKLPVDEYDLKYLNKLLDRSGAYDRTAESQVSFNDDFYGYSRNFKLFCEGKFFSRTADISGLASRLAKYEGERESLDQEVEYRSQLKGMWRLVQKLDLTFPPTKRPSVFSILISVGDQRIDGACKSEVELQVAKVSCLNLEELYMESILNIEQGAQIPQAGNVIKKLT